MGRLLKCLNNFLSNHNFKVMYKENYSELKNVSYVLSQETISSHLFNIVTLDLVQELENDATTYADDSVLWNRDADVNALNKLQMKLNKIIKFWMAIDYKFLKQISLIYYLTFFFTIYYSRKMLHLFYIDSLIQFNIYQAG